jgi:GT2 family glycosyltransferase
MNHPRASVVVTNFKQVSDLALSLDALLQTNYPNLEIVVVDCCTSNFNEWMNKKYHHLRAIHFCEDIGTAGQRNVGFKSVDRNSKYVCFVDDDVIVSPEWLVNIIELMENDEQIGATQPLLFNYRHKSEIDSLGCLMTRTVFPYRIETTEENLSNLKSKRIMDIFYGELAVMVFRTEALLGLNNDLRPFDDDYLFGWDDVDLSWRIWLLGYRVIITSDSICYHNRDINTRLAKLYPSRTAYLATRGRLISMLKNYEVIHLIKYLPVTILIELLKSAVLLRYKPSHAISVFKAILWPLTHFPRILRKRSVSRSNLIRPNSGLEAVFIRTSPIDLLRQFKKSWV